MAYTWAVAQDLHHIIHNALYVVVVFIVTEKLDNGRRRSKGFGFVIFTGEDEANECKAALDNRVSSSK